MIKQEPIPTRETLALLARLTRKGARLQPAEDGKGFMVATPGAARRDARAAARAFVDQDMVTAAADAGWIVAVERGGYRLTESGAVALRRGAGNDRQPLDVAPGQGPSTPITVPVAASRTGGTLSPLVRLRQKRDAKGAPALSGVQVEAGERLARDFGAGQMMPRVTANWDRARLGFALESRPGIAGDLHDGATAAQDRVRRALDDAGPELAGLLIDVCCLEIGMEQIERQRQWPPRTARIVLGLALDRLMRHYGMVARGPDRGKPAHWGDTTYRPTIERWKRSDPTGNGDSSIKE